MSLFFNFQLFTFSFSLSPNICDSIRLTSEKSGMIQSAPASIRRCRFQRSTPCRIDAGRAAWAKLPGYAAKIALVFHIVEWLVSERCSLPGQVSERTMATAIRVTDWFKGEAVRILQSVAKSGKGVCDRTETRILEVIQNHGERQHPVTWKDQSGNIRRLISGFRLMSSLVPFLTPTTRNNAKTHPDFVCFAVFGMVRVENDWDFVDQPGFGEEPIRNRVGVKPLNENSPRW